ncbi:NAD-dependent epimerase/dehydratase family protein [Candidatus Woesearchaeota archaeon]|nr:NAD-dependent epimerase/dehydratase family protein [Candidatus Woesearchaeota archaeon]HIH48014.1 NAD-dependent epimerase/dehydratase family protein [Candidatus Woesearchaeota archaeon]
MKCFVTGGAGFIGSHLVDALIEAGHSTTIYDNFSVGGKEHIAHHLHDEKFTLIRADLLDFRKISSSIAGHDVVFHLAANSDISNNKVTDLDLKQGTLATYNILESMRLGNVKKIVFSSSSAIYGEAKVTPTPEDYGPLFPISFYGASKLAGESLISSFCHNFGMRAWIYRFPNVVGERFTHGVLYDFIKKLERNQKELEILGDGEQSKPYLYVKDVVDAMLFGLNNSHDEVNYFNITPKGSTKVKDIAKMIVDELGLSNVKFTFTGGYRGWPGDVARVNLDGTKLAQLGWKKDSMSDECIRKAIKALLAYHKSHIKIGKG